MPLTMRPSPFQPPDTEVNRCSHPIVRFFDKVTYDPATRCWEWTGYVAPNGYGQLGDASQLHYAHRWAYEYFVNAIPDGLHIDHLCRNRRCVNPDHLEAVTQRENNQRSWDARKETTR